METGQSVLGHKADEFSDVEKQWIHTLATALRTRERAVDRQDMGLYVRAAGALFDLARRLNNSPTKFPQKSVMHWLHIMTGVNTGAFFIPPEPPTVDTEAKDGQGHTPVLEAAGREEGCLDVEATTVPGDGQPEVGVRAGEKGDTVADHDAALGEASGVEGVGPA